MFHRAWFHVGSDKSEQAARIAGCIQRFATVRIVCGGGVTQELPALRFAGAIFVIQNSSEELSAVLALRRASPAIPLLVLFDVVCPRALDLLQAEGVEVATTMAQPASLVAFVQRSLAAHFAGTPRVSEVVRTLARDRGLTPRELQLLSYALGDDPRARIRRRLGISENTLKTEVRGLIRKCGARNADALAKQVLRTALRLPGCRDDVSTQSSPVRPYAVQGWA